MSALIWRAELVMRGTRAGRAKMAIAAEELESTVSQAQLTSVDLQGPEAELRAIFDKQRAAYLTGAPNYQQRREALQKIHDALQDHADDIIAAIDQDFGHRSAHETVVAEIMILLEECKHARSKLKGWMKPRRALADLNFLPARIKIYQQPLGVVGVIGAWNYPVQLTFGPMIGAIAAGNHVIMKPSEFGPKSGELMARIIADNFPPEYVTVVNGGADVSAAFSALPFDHLVFTGSTQTGRLVAQAAAKNLTPVTLELGGKSPAIIGRDFSPAKMGKRLMFGKLFNAGQTCIAPDYVLAPEDKLDEVVGAIKEQVAKSYPQFSGNPDYTSIIHQRHYDRLKAMLADAEAKGAKVISASANEETPNDATRTLPPMLVLNPTADMQVMQEEIFGPILPVKTYNDFGEVTEHVKHGDRPLALYYFGHKKAEQERIMTEIVCGGVSINDTIVHQPQSKYGFGGVGASGMGAYHGEVGFKRFSKETGVTIQPGFTPFDWLRAPYGGFFNTVMRVLTGWKAK